MKVCFFDTSCQQHESFNALVVRCKQKYDVVVNPCEADYIIEFFCGMAFEKLKNLIIELAFIKKIKRECNKHITYILCGCIVDALGKELLKELSIIDYAYGKNEINQIFDLLELDYLSSASKVIVSNLTNKKRLLLPIQDGCLNKCAFCKVHYLKQKLRSVPIEVLLERIRKYTQEGVDSVDICGLNTGHYGIDLYGKKMILRLLREISSIPEIKDISVNCLAIQDLDEEILKELVSNPKIHSVMLCIQSASNKVLRNMSVNHTSEYAENVVRQLRNKRLLTAFIVGYPGENRQDFEKTFDLIKRNELFLSHISRYDDTPGTMSFNLKDKKDAFKRYSTALKRMDSIRTRALNSFIGKRINGYFISVIKYNEEYDRVILEPQRFDGAIYIDIPCGFFDGTNKKYSLFSCKILNYVVLKSGVILWAEDMEIKEEKF